MKNLAPLLALLVLCNGCAHDSQSIPPAGISLASADYTIGDWVEGESCSNYLLWINLAGFFVYEAGRIDGAGWGWNADQERAVFKALSNAEGATNLYAPRFRTTSKGFLILFSRPMFGQRCVLVSGRTVTLKSGPVPNAH